MRTDGSELTVNAALRGPCVMLGAALLAWFALAMTGAGPADRPLVTAAWAEDWPFFVAYLLAFGWFAAQGGRGSSTVLSVWLALWASTQAAFHWWHTLVGGGADTREYFATTMKLITSDERYVPDLYHLVLHALILGTLTCVLIRTWQEWMRPASGGGSSPAVTETRP